MTPLGEANDGVGLDPAEFLEFSALFVDVATRELARLEAAIEGSHPALAAEAAHSIKGAAASMDFREILACAARLEAQARRGSLAGARGEMESIGREVRLLREALSAQLGEWEAACPSMGGLT
jgi:HPt (histidine-containing phosphotransfer) domain-containing protein